MYPHKHETAFLPAFIRSLRHPEWMPEGVNTWDEPLNGRIPVVLLHGTWLNVYNSFSLIAPALRRAGHAVFCTNYGHDSSPITGRPSGVFATAALRKSQAEVAAFITRVREHTGAPQVDIVAHSQGVAQARLFLSDSGGYNPHTGTSLIRKLIGIGPSNHGTSLSGIGAALSSMDRTGRVDKLALKLLGQAALDQRQGSEAVEHLNRNGDTVPGVEYTMISTRFDQIVTPWQSQKLAAGPGAHVRNILIQDGSSKDFSDHLAMLYSPRVVDLIVEQLHTDPGNYRDSHPQVSAWVVPWFGEITTPTFPRLPHWLRRGRRAL